MKAQLANLNANVGTTYLKTRTSVAGRSSQKTINSQNVIGPPLSRFIDTFTEAGISPGSASYCSPNGRLFIPTAITGGVLTIALYTVNLGPGVPTTRYQYVGKIQANLPNSATTTHTIRYLKVYDGANAGVTTGWKILVGTLGSILENGGNFMINGVNLSDFVPVGLPIFYPALSNNVRGIYQLQETGFMGINTNVTALIGSGLSRSDQRLYFTNGTAGTFNIACHDISISPTVTPLPNAVTPPSSGATWNSTAHGLSANDPVVLITTGTVPTGFTASVQTANPTVYWVNATNLTANSFELKTTKAGSTSLSATGAATGTVTVLRAWGATGALHDATKKTASITSSFVGTALLADNQGITTINDVASPNNGQVCYFFPTSSNFYNFRLSDVVAGATTLPTTNTVNALGTDIVAPTVTFALYSDTVANIVYSVTSFSFQMKKWVNSQLQAVFGGQVNTWLENSPNLTQFFGMSGIVGMEEREGWLFVGQSASVGQRGVFMVDMLSDDRFGYSYAISPIMDFGGSSRLNFVTSLEELYNITDSTNIYIRSSANPNDTLFDSPTGGWTYYSGNADLSAFSLLRYVQVMVTHTILSLLSSTPSQVKDLVIGHTPINELSDYWLGDVDNTSVNGASPAYSAFRLRRTYSGSVPQIFFRAYDDSNNLVASADTVTNPTLFEYSTNGGTSWTPMGTIPNTAGTVIRYKWATPPGVAVTVSIRES